MKIEKVNDHQIRCTLTKNDLADRELKISELAYGTEKAKSLFRDMMQQAAYEFGFEADDIPLMIEAIPLNSECIVLIITKVENPEELDTRFSNFAPSVDESNEENDDYDDYESDGLSLMDNDTDEVMDLFRKLHDEKMEQTQESKTNPQKESAEDSGIDNSRNITRIFSFLSLNELACVSNILNKFYHGSSALYKDHANEKYLLVVSRDGHTPNEFNKVCNTLSEYGNFERNGNACIAFLEEHYECIIANDAIRRLSLIR